jgi:hypothetical protein
VGAASVGGRTVAMVGSGTGVFSNPIKGLRAASKFRGNEGLGSKDCFLNLVKALIMTLGYFCVPATNFCCEKTCYSLLSVGS